VSLVGINIKPLGIDRHGSEYWKFPTCADLFVLVHCSPSPSPPSAELDSIRSGYNLITVRSDYSRKQWKRVSVADMRQVQLLVDLLDAPSEAGLRTSLVTIFLMEQQQLQQLQSKGCPDLADNARVSENDEDVSKKSNGEGEEVGVEGEEGDGEEQGEEEDEEEEEEGGTRRKGKKGKGGASFDNVPVALKLLTSKGVDIPKTFRIEKESAFEYNVLAEEDDFEDDEQRSYEYFTFSKGRR
jgi:hypothetical protein